MSEAVDTTLDVAVEPQQEDRPRFSCLPRSSTEERPLLTRQVMDSFISMRLRPNEGPKHIDAFSAARDFYESRITRDYVFRPEARAKVEELLSTIETLWEHIHNVSGDQRWKERTEVLRQTVRKVTQDGGQLFLRQNVKGKP